MAERGVVVDHHGNVVEDDDVVRDGHAVRVALEFMDAEQREVMQADEQRERVLDAYARMCARVSRGMHKRRVVTELPDGWADSEDFDHRAAAYDAMKKRLSKRRAPKPRDPSWVRP